MLPGLISYPIALLNAECAPWVTNNMLYVECGVDFESLIESVLDGTIASAKIGGRVFVSNE